MRPRGLAPLQARGFRLLMAGQLASNLGDAVYAVALPWYVLATDGGAVRLGVVLAAYGIARAGGLAVGGQVSDRLAPWNAMLGADLVRAVAVGALALAAAIGPARLGLLVPVAAVAGAGEGIFLPGSFAIAPALLAEDHLQAGNAMLSGATQLATLVGPALGGLLISVAGPSPGFGIDAASFAASIATLAGIRTVTGARTSAATAPTPRGETTLRRLIATEPVVLLMFGLNVAANLGSGGMSEVALPALALGPLLAGEAGSGALVAALGGGALLGTLVAAQAPRPRRPAFVASLAFLADAGLLATVPYLGPTAAAAAALVAYGTLNGFANVLTITAIQRWSPRDLLGRMMGFLLLGAFGVFPLSVLLAAVVAHAAGPALFFPLAGAVLGITVGFSLTQPAWRAFGAVAAPA